MYPTYVSRAVRRDVDQIFYLVNEAFQIETGNEGIAYRSGEKYHLKDQTRKHIADMLVLRDHKQILGVIKSSFHNGTCDIGLIAVHPEHQGMGYGAKLMEAAETRNKASRFTVGLASCRSDVIPFFEKRGYKQLVEKPIEEMRKLYPEDLAEKFVSRDDICWTIFVKKNSVCENGDEDDGYQYNAQRE